MKSFDPKNAHKNKDRCSKCGDSTHVEGFQCLAKKFQCKACHKFGHFTSLCYQKKQHPFKSSRPTGTSNCKQEQCMCVRIPYAASMKRVPVMTHSACNSKYSTHNPVSRRFPYQLTWLQILLTGWNIIIPEISTLGQDWTLVWMWISCLANVYRLVFKDPESEEACLLVPWSIGPVQYRHSEDCRILHILFGPPRHQEVTGSYILCCWKW